ncbi:YheC/YheD family protein [Salinithrix halophila]|uniref:YheC/YheD family protein n=1 Tax=Salinithrix halophila TaxID=1485204 RepID=A0ABV8JF71_9BACL
MQKYLKYNPGREGKLFAFTYKGVDWERKVIRGLCRRGKKWVKRTIPFPSCVINKRFTTKTRACRRLEREIGKGFVFNVKNRFDKWVVYKILHASPVRPYLPFTVPLENRRLRALLNPGSSWFVKPRNGYKGKRVYKVSRGPAVFHIHTGSNTPAYSFKDRHSFEAKLRSLVGGAPCIMQREIPLLPVKKQLAEIRFFVQKDGTGRWRGTGGFAKVSYPDVHLTNHLSHMERIPEVLKQSGFEESRHEGIIEKLQKVGTQTAAHLERQIGHLGEITVDFGVDREGKPWIIEVNGFPSTQLIEESENPMLIRTYYSRPLQYAAYLTKKKRRRQKHGHRS